MNTLFSNDIVERIAPVVEELANMPIQDRVDAINRIRRLIHKHSPFASEPVDCVEWVSSDLVVANDYNPNSVAPPEMKLLEHSIKEDGYTQPIVSWNHDSVYEVVDGFHRHRVGKESSAVRSRVMGYLPVVVINDGRSDITDRMSATIRHNRARGKHRVEGMSDIVVELKRRNWTDERIARELGMDQDEILRLCQITGMAELFKDQEFSQAWDVEGDISESDIADLTDETDDEEYRTVNTSDENRVFHTFDKWECHRAGFYASHKDGWTQEQCEQAYRDILGNSETFERVAREMMASWTHSCEHYLTNVAMNRIAWIGQAAVCYATGVPSAFRSAYGSIPAEQRAESDAIALRLLNEWLEARKMDSVTMEQAVTDRQSMLY